MMAKQSYRDIDVTSKNDKSMLRQFKISMENAKNAAKEPSTSKHSDTQLPDDGEYENDDDDEEQSYIAEAANADNSSRRNPWLWQRPEIRSILGDFISKDITSRAAANRIAEIIGRRVSHSTVLNYANKLLRSMKHGSDDPSSYDIQLEQDAPELSSNLVPCVRYEFVKTSRGSENGLAIHETDGFVRIYRRTSTTGRATHYRCSMCDHLRTSTTGRATHYRCSMCDHLYEKTGHGERPSIKMRGDVICSNPYPAHNPMCVPAREETFRKTQRDLEARQLNACKRSLINFDGKMLKQRL
ncbi:unnamed protein product [Gongylonema pulchrum]|uniref:HTH_48 domain-containing protein n=1 Tax=Gongylonema pulchrum TaxID=637853 RepID=A0A183EJ77_9BILA|nr:unnamed protein product [Gongylonema pulchrum]